MNSLGGDTSLKKNQHLDYLERCIEMSMVNGERREDSMPLYSANSTLDHLTT